MLFKEHPINFSSFPLLFLRMLILVPGGSVTDWFWDSHGGETVSNDEKVLVYDLTDFSYIVCYKPVMMCEEKSLAICSCKR